MYPVSNYGNDPNPSILPTTDTLPNKTIVFIQRRMQYRLRQVLIQYQTTCDKLRRLEIDYAKRKIHMQRYLCDANLLDTITIDPAHCSAARLTHELNQIDYIPKILAFAIQHPILKTPPQRKQFINDIHCYIEHHKLSYDYHNGVVCVRYNRPAQQPVSLYGAGYDASFISCFESALIRFRMLLKKMQCYYDELIELQDKIVVYRSAQIQKNGYCRTQEHYKLCCSLHSSLLSQGPIRYLQQGYQIVQLLAQCHVD